MDWINTQVCRDLAYGLVYPQIFPNHKRGSDQAQQAAVQWGRERAQGWLKVMNEHLLTPGNKYLCGDSLTIAGYFASSFIALGEIVGTDYSAYPNVKAWLGRMKALRTWKEHTDQGA
ncbi:MAG: glutathione S-transferase family protein [Burkholderiales bacterium]